MKDGENGHEHERPINRVLWRGSGNTDLALQVEEEARQVLRLRLQQVEQVAVALYRSQGRAEQSITQFESEPTTGLSEPGRPSPPRACRASPCRGP